MEKKSLKHSLKKICSKKRGLIGWKPGYFQKKFFHTLKSVPLL